MVVSGTMKFFLCLFLAVTAVVSSTLALSDTHPSNIRQDVPDIKFLTSIYRNAHIDHFYKNLHAELTRLHDIHENTEKYYKMYREEEKFREKVMNHAKKVILDSEISGETKNKAIKEFELLDHFVRTESWDDAYKILQLGSLNVPFLPIGEKTY